MPSGDPKRGVRRVIEREERMSRESVVDRLHRAAHSLAVGAGRVNERLYKALVELSTIGPEELPTGDREKLQAIRGLTLLPWPGEVPEGNLSQKVAVMPEGLAVAYANEIFEFFLQTARQVGNS